MANRTFSISMPDNMADFVEREVKNGDFASTSDFVRILVREYQAHNHENWADKLISQRLATAENPDNLIPQADFEREILGRAISDPAN
jgi:Arc/MetJ-type ribon-helix-helix transcriptional regulator